MNFALFLKNYAHLPVIESSMVVQTSHENPQHVRNQLLRWTKKKHLTQIKKGLYVLDSLYRDNEVNEYYLANRLYEPSYISLESALSHYEIIPERVRSFTSVTSKKTNQFHNTFGQFQYQHIKSTAFRGFISVEVTPGVSVFMAEPEKAVVDFLYLNLSKFDKNVVDQLLNSYRFQEYETLNTDKLEEYSRYFGCKKLEYLTKLFTEFIKEERSHD